MSKKSELETWQVAPQIRERAEAISSWAQQNHDALNVKYQEFQNNADHLPLAQAITELMATLDDAQRKIGEINQLLQARATT